MCGRPSTTIGFERRFNPLAGLDREALVATLAMAIPARPLHMVVIEATNRGTVDMSWAMVAVAPDIPQVALTAVAERWPDAVVLDVREPDEYAQGHVPGHATCRRRSWRQARSGDMPLPPVRLSSTWACLLPLAVAVSG